jgi:neutral ceramidase
MVCIGPKCIDTGEDCNNESSTCCKNGICLVRFCIAFGPGKDMEESTKIIGERQFNKAKELYNSATEEIKGPVQYQHQFVNMSTVQVEVTNSTGQKEVKQLCKAALGYSFAAGTTVYIHIYWVNILLEIVT